jgi:hypothetical protein
VRGARRRIRTDTRGASIASLDQQHICNSPQIPSNRKVGIGCANRREDHSRSVDVTAMTLLESTMKFTRESVDYTHAAVLGLVLLGHSVVFNSTPDQRPAARGCDPNACGRIHERASCCVPYKLGDNHPQTPALLRIDLKFSLQQFKPDPPETVTSRRLSPRKADADTPSHLCSCEILESAARREHARSFQAGTELHRGLS